MTALRSLVAGLLLFGTGGMAAGSTTDADQTRPALTAGKPPEYDLAIVKIGSAVRWQGGLAEPATLDISLVSLGLRDVRQPEVECRLERMTLRSMGATSLMRRNEPYQLQVQMPGREAFDIKPGRYPVTCTARIVQPREARDGDGRNDALTDAVTLEAPPRPDLAVQSVGLRDCETRGSAVAGRPLCIEVAFALDRRGSAIVTSWSVVCEVEGTKAATPGESPIDKGSVGVAIVHVEPLAAGEHVAVCSVDGQNAIDETDETNNQRTEKVLVLADSSDTRYDLALVDIGPSVGEIRDESAKQPSVFIDVRLKNLGSQPILEADARCDLGATGLAFLSVGSISLQPGQEASFRVLVWGRRLSQVPAGAHETTCVAGIVLPKGIVESDIENNVRTGKVARR